MSKNDKNTATGGDKPKTEDAPELKDAPDTNKLPDEDELNPLDDLKEQIEGKDQEDKTPQEEFVEGQANLKEYRDAASSGNPTPGGGPSGASAGLAEGGAEQKDIVPPVTAEPTEPSEDDEDFAVEEAEEVEFEPIPDSRATLHGTHDAAMVGLQTDVSGAYVPPGLVDQHQSKVAEQENEERLARSREQQDALRYDNGLRRGRL